MFSRLTEKLRSRLLYRRYSNRSMLGRRLFTENLLLAKSHLNKSGIKGCYVECGIWAGGLSFAMMDALPQITKFYLFDSFEGLPEPTIEDGEEAKDPGNLWHDNNKADYDDFMRALTRTGHSNVEVYKGWFKETLPNFRPAYPIAILRLDGDWYESTMTCLLYLYDRVMSGGLIIIDDYDDWVGCRKALHDFLSAAEAPERIQRSPRGVVYLIKE